MEAAHEDAEIIFGTVIDESLKDTVKVTVIATGLGGANLAAAAAIQAGAQSKVVTPTLEINTAATIAVPPAPNAAMLANAASVSTASSEVSIQEPVVSQIAKSPSMGAGAEGGELARARALATKLGISSLTDDEYDVPTYIRRQHDKDQNL